MPSLKKRPSFRWMPELQRDTIAQRETWKKTIFLEIAGYSQSASAVKRAGRKWILLWTPRLTNSLCVNPPSENNSFQSFLWLSLVCECVCVCAHANVNTCQCQRYCAPFWRKRETEADKFCNRIVLEEKNKISEKYQIRCIKSRTEILGKDIE